MITFQVEDQNGDIRDVEVPEEINLNLMEVLKASEYPILATCGGMALCATCHVGFIKGLDNISEPEDAELDMLDTLPDADEESRLACQIAISPALEGAHIKLRASEDEY